MFPGRAAHNHRLQSGGEGFERTDSAGVPGSAEEELRSGRKGCGHLQAGSLAQLLALPGGQMVQSYGQPGTYDDNDPIGVLDVTISSNLILDEILGIKDLRSDKRIDFVGGIRGLGELKKRVDSGEMKMALALYPVSMKQLMDIADTGNIMPPKTTWFEPKLRSGLVIHKLE